MIGSRFKKSVLGAWLTAVALAGASAAGVMCASVASADVSVGIDVAPEITVSDPDEVTVTSEPPDPLYEERTDLPGPGYVWVGGYWGWRGSDWGWYPGRWLMAPEGRVYIEPYYERSGPNVIYVGGYWGRPDAPRRSYGGERIRFAMAPRPPDYRRGEAPRFERRAGVPIGTRPAGFYEHATGPVRPIPPARGPSYRAVPHESQAPHDQPGREPPGREPHRDTSAAPPRAVNHESPAPPREMARGAPAPHMAPAPHGAPPRRK